MKEYTTELIDLSRHSLLISNMKLREADIFEIETVHGCDYQTALFSVVRANEGSCSISFCNGVPFVIHGAKENGLIWAVGTDLIAQAGLSVIRWGRDLVETYQDKHRVLWNYMDRRNTVHARWLSAMGFVFTGDWEIFGGQPFIHFERIRRT